MISRETRGNRIGSCVKMSALGQYQRYAVQKAMSALAPIATSNATVGMSAMGQKRTSMPSIRSPHRQTRSGRTEWQGRGFWRLEIDHEFKFCRLKDRKIGWLPNSGELGVLV